MTVSLLNFWVHCGHSNECYWEVLSCDVVYYAEKQDGLIFWFWGSCFPLSLFARFRDRFPSSVPVSSVWHDIQPVSQLFSIPLVRDKAWQTVSVTNHRSGAITGKIAKRKTKRDAISSIGLIVAKQCICHRLRSVSIESFKAKAKQPSGRV